MAVALNCWICIVELRLLPRLLLDGDTSCNLAGEEGMLNTLNETPLAPGWCLVLFVGDVRLRSWFSSGKTTCDGIADWFTTVLFRCLLAEVLISWALKNKECLSSSRLNAWQLHLLICQDGLIRSEWTSCCQDTYLLLTSCKDPFALLDFGLARVKLFPLRTRR